MDRQTIHLDRPGARMASLPEVSALLGDNFLRLYLFESQVISQEHVSIVLLEFVLHPEFFTSKKPY